MSQASTSTLIPAEPVDPDRHLSLTWELTVTDHIQNAQLVINGLYNRVRDARRHDLQRGKSPAKLRTILHQTAGILVLGLKVIRNEATFAAVAAGGERGAARIELVKECDARIELVSPTPSLHHHQRLQVVILIRNRS